MMVSYFHYPKRKVPWTGMTENPVRFTDDGTILGSSDASLSHSGLPTFTSPLTLPATIAVTSESVAAGGAEVTPYPPFRLTPAEIQQCIAVVLEQRCDVERDVVKAAVNTGGSRGRGAFASGLRGGTWTPVCRKPDQHDAAAYERVIVYPKHDGTVPELKRLYPGPLFDAGCTLLKHLQERAMLATRVSGRPSFHDVWNSSEAFRQELLDFGGDAAGKGKWALRSKYGYQIPAAFIPCVAASLYQEFSQLMGGKRNLKVLDPCAGWGDRLIGACASLVVGEYCGVDPNGDVFPGYCTAAAAMKSAVRQDRSLSLRSTEDVDIKTTFVMQGFEQCGPYLPKAYFDVVFTSPPFHTYEVYTESNPTYDDWEKEFYEPLVRLSMEAVAPGGIVAFHIEDTSAGRVPEVIRSRAVGKLWAVDVGFGKRLTSVWLLQRPPGVETVECHHLKRSREA